MNKLYFPNKKIISCFFLVISLFIAKGFAQESAYPSTLPEIKYHLTARPWQALNISKDAYLDRVEGIVRQIVKFQNSNGAIIDPYSKHEEQYSTPYFAYSIGVLLSAGRANDLLDEGIKAMNSATGNIAAGVPKIPSDHGEFFLAPLSGAIPLYTPHITTSQLAVWKERMATPVEKILRGRTHNWRTYAMKGEWYRAKNGYVKKPEAVAWLEDSWLATQKRRLTNNSWNFYHDETSDPDTWPYESAARGNLINMVFDGYDGASRNDMLTLLKRGTQSSLLFQDPTGQGAAGGRSGNHTWNDIVMANGYETMAELAYSEGDSRLAGQYRRAAALGFLSVQRWLRPDGTYSVTKNQFNPSQRVRYATYSHFTNYNGYMMFHMAENYLRHTSVIPEQPAPNEIGGYSVTTDTSLATAVANAGGMQMEVSLRGAKDPKHGVYWTALGAVRFSRTGWDSRLGPSDGVRETMSKQGTSFAPVFLENGKWIRVASIPDRYEATFNTLFSHPLLVRCQVIYKPKSGKTGPTFTNNFSVTPDGILSILTSDSKEYGVTYPLLTYDGTTKLKTAFTTHIASTSFPQGTDEQHYIALNPSATLTTSEALNRSSYGDLLPVRMVSKTSINVTYIYPRSAGDPSAEAVRTSYTRTDKDFSTILGRVKGDTYVGRTSAGGIADSIDLDLDGTADTKFSTSCGFILQLKDGKVTTVEADRAVVATIQGKEVNLQPYTPVNLLNLSKLTVASVIARSDDGNKPVNTIDGSPETRWSAYGNGQWIRFKLDTLVRLKSVDIAWYRGDERAANFEIQSSVDSLNWVTLFKGKSSGSTKDLESYDVPDSVARYVRIMGRGNNLNTWNAITEVEIHGTPDSSVSPLKPLSVTARSDDGNKPINTIDGNLETRWSAFGDWQWIRYDLGTPAFVKSIDIAWYRGNERSAGFRVQTSLDSINWSNRYIGNSSGKTADLENYDMTDTLARYVRIVCRGNNLNTWNAITEVVINFVPNQPDTIPALPKPLLLLSAEKPKHQFKQSSTGLNDLENNTDAGFFVWPNPSSGLFSLQPTSAEWAGAELFIYNSQGEVVWKQKIGQEITAVDLSHHAKGMYLIRLSLGQKIAHGRVIIQ